MLLWENLRQKWVFVLTEWWQRRVLRMVRWRSIMRRRIDTWRVHVRWTTWEVDLRWVIWVELSMMTTFTKTLCLYLRINLSFHFEWHIVPCHYNSSILLLSCSQNIDTRRLYLGLNKLLIIQTIFQDTDLPYIFPFLVAVGAGNHSFFSDEFPSLATDWSVSPPSGVFP